MTEAANSSPLGVRADIRHLDFIDGLRGLAILMVFTLHLSEFYAKMPRVIDRLAMYGQYGVQLFFVVSAFTLFMSFAQRSGVDRKPVTAFLLRRFFRIAPMYWFALIFYVWTEYTKPGYVINALDVASDKIAANIFFIHAWRARWMNTIVPGGWSVGVEMSFYLLVPLIFRWINSLNKAVVMFGVSIIVGTVLTLPVGQMLLSMARPGDGVQVRWFTYYWLPAEMPVFALGIIMYFILKPAMTAGGQPMLPKWLNARACLLAAGGLVVLLALIDAHAKPFTMNWGHIGFSIAFLLLGLGLAQGAPPIFVTRTMRYLGTISYSAYLTHFFVIVWVGDFVAFLGRHGIPMPHAVAFVMHYGLALCATFITATITYRLVEQPGIRLGKWIIQRIGAGSPSKSKAPATVPSSVKSDVYTSAIAMPA